LIRFNYNHVGLFPSPALQSDALNKHVLD